MNATASSSQTNRCRGERRWNSVWPSKSLGLARRTVSRSASVEAARVFAGSDILAKKLYIDLVFDPGRIDGQLDLEKLLLGNKLEAFAAEFNRFDMLGHGLVVQIAAQKHVNLPGWNIRIEKRENQRLFLMDNVIQHALVQKAPRIDGNSWFKPELLHNREKVGEVSRIRSHRNIDIHRHPFDAVQNACHTAANDEVNISINQCGENFLILAHDEKDLFAAYLFAAGALTKVIKKVWCLP